MTAIPIWPVTLQVSRQPAIPLPGRKGARLRRGRPQAVETAEDTSVTATPRQEPNAEGMVLGRYRLVRRLGTGGFGTVWLAHDERLERAVAVKRIPVESAGAGVRAEREALAAARLSHAGIVTLYEAGRDDDAVYLVSELVRGQTLGQLLQEGELSDRDAVEAGIALCEALSHAHARGVIHRDVKPANIIVPDGHSPDVPRAVRGAKLTDFGIARVLGDDALTATGDVVGTLAYMAPEQADGRPVTEAADLYAAALVVYEALAGVNPVRQPGAAATARRVGMRLPPLARLRRDLPGRLCRALDRAVLPDPEDRGTLGELRDELVRALPELEDVPGTIAPARVDVLADHTVRAAARVEEWTAAHPWPVAPPAEGWQAQEEWQDEALERPTPPGRIAAALAAAGLVAAALAGIGPPAPVPVVVAAALVGALTAVLPRIGWLAGALGVIAWLVVEEPGTALLVAAAVLPVVLLLPGRGRLWSAPAGAVLLGVVSLALAWTAVAGQCRRARDRLALGALGAWWALLAQPILGRDTLLERAPGGRPARGWPASAVDAWNDVLLPLLSSGALAIVVLWAAAALVLPWIVRGMSASVDAVGAAMWAAGFAAATGSVLHAVDPSGTLSARGIVAGAIVAAVLAVAARAVRGGAWR